MYEEVSERVQQHRSAHRREEPEKHRPCRMSPGLWPHGAAYRRARWLLLRVRFIPKLLKTLYEDKLSGKTSEDNYCVLSQKYSAEIFR